MCTYVRLPLFSKVSLSPRKDQKPLLSGEVVLGGQRGWQGRFDAVLSLPCDLEQVVIVTVATTYTRVQGLPGRGGTFFLPRTTWVFTSFKGHTELSA